MAKPPSAVGSRDVAVKTFFKYKEGIMLTGKAVP